ncbi:MLP-like protein 34 [Silene latifolia]|uniref:MLP-like protein 34 n=1 Tax=Silene latifolia TaxID=37657 RepID=UPI003D76B2A3
MIIYLSHIDGKRKTIKQKLEVVDEENKVMKFKCIDGELMKEYNYLIVTFEAVPVSNETSKVIWTFEYEKKEPGLPEPTAEMDALVTLAKEIDDHHHGIDGKRKTIKQKLEVVDEENKVMKFKCIDGELMKEYNYLIVTFEAVPVSNETSKVIWTFEYEKKEPGLPEPTAEMDALVTLAKEIDDHHHGIGN